MFEQSKKTKPEVTARIRIRGLMIEADGESAAEFLAELQSLFDASLGGEEDGDDK